MAKETSDQKTSDNMVDIVRHLYPDALTRSYIVPPVHFNRVPYDKKTITDQEVLVLPSSESLKPEQKIETQTDFAQQHVLYNLQELIDSGKEVMFVVSELNFKDYLNNPFYAKQTGKLPKPTNLPKEHRHHGKQGDFDILVIHRQYGILVGEMKSVGKTEASRADTQVVRVIDKAVKQLKKSEVHARHMVSDIAPGLTVRKTLFLPYVSRAQLQRILDDKNNAKLQEAVCLSLGATNTVEAVQLCCCSDQLSQPASYWLVTPAVLSQLTTWWQYRMACTEDTLLSDDTYLEIVARFVGPATTVSVPCYNGVRVDVRTAGRAVAELGRRLAVFVLTLQQLGIMHRNPQRIFLTGPPGTGKTVLLVLQGVRWLRQGHDVQVISTDYATRAISKMITEQIRESLTSPPNSKALVLHQYQFRTREKEVQQAFTDLLGRVNEDGKLFVLLDEMMLGGSDGPGQRLCSLVTRLTESVPHLHLWVAATAYTDIPPTLQPEALTVPLRCAPSVLREIQPAVGKFTTAIHQYSVSGVPAPGDGLRVINLSHHGNAHTGRFPVDCVKCGHEIAAQLRDLGVGSWVSGLSYRDVFIMTRSVEEATMDVAGRVVSPASGLVRGLREKGFPVGVLEGLDEAMWVSAVHDVAMAVTDIVTVTHWSHVQGLERPVVVMLPGRENGFNEHESDATIAGYDRLFAASRCSTQLIYVNMPPVTTATSHSNDNDGDHDQPRKIQRTKKKDNSNPTGVSWVKKKGFLL